jgi:hypothetical protein
MNVLDEAYERLLAAGPEFGGFLSNHGPMVVEVLAHHGFADEIHPWLDRYEQQLEPRPRGGTRIDDWHAALGDVGRLGDWLDHFEDEMVSREWREVLAVWWPRLIPGIAAAATHGVIRVGHAVRALGDADTPTRRRELGAALASWAARYRLIPTSRPAGAANADEALALVPTVADQTGGVGHRVAQLTATPGWHDALRSLRMTTDPEAHLARTADVVAAAARRYLTHGHGSGVMLVHAVTAPTAVLRSMPVLARDHWEVSADFAWAAAAALHAAYAAPAARQADVRVPDRSELMARAVEHGDEHVIKLADAVVDAFARTSDPTLLAAGAHGLDLIPASSLAR